MRTFGGGSTSYEGLAAGCPIVTLPSHFLKGRITYALYQKMKLLDTVVYSPKDYIRIALQLGQEPDFRQMITEKIIQQRSVLYENKTTIKEFEETLIRVVHRV